VFNTIEEKAVKAKDSEIATKMMESKVTKVIVHHGK
jgi:hypothetical protein